jgi:cobyrinic acid a,c-diamide synthase
VLNRVGGSRHEAKLRAVIEHYTDVPVLGAVAEDPQLAMTERHLGLMPCAEVDDARERVQAIGRIIGRQVDLPAVRGLAATAAPRPSFGPAAAARRPDLRIGIARDRAFGFYYADDLAALQAAGAELVPIDTLHDSVLPDIDGLFIGGGFPEACMDELQANAALRTALRRAIEAGLPTYAECGGLMYLSRSISWQGRTAAMVGAIPGDAVMHARPVGRGYVQLQETGALPWGEPGACGADTSSTIPACRTWKPACASRTSCSAVTAWTAPTTACWCTTCWPPTPTCAAPPAPAGHHASSTGAAAPRRPAAAATRQALPAACAC